MAAIMLAYLVSQSQFGMDFLMDKLLQEVHQHEGDRQQIHVQYTVIDSEWNVLHHKNSRWIMCAPRFPGARYKESGN